MQIQIADISILYKNYFISMMRGNFFGRYYGGRRLIQESSQSASEAENQEEQERKNFFQDPQNPWKDAKEQIQCLFIKNEKGQVSISQKQFPFKPKQTEMNFCCRNYQPDLYVFTCYDCSKSSGCVLCQHCWVPEKHEGHNFNKSQCYSEGQSYCDCGISCRIKEEAFCNNHGQRQLSIEIPEEEKQKFMNYFGKLYEIYFYMLKLRKKGEKVHKQLLAKINKFFKGITKNSAYYSRLILQVWDTVVVVKNQKQTIFQYLSKKHKIEGMTILRMTGDLDCLYKLLKKYAYLQKEKKRQFISGFLSGTLFHNFSVFEKLGNEGIFIESKKETYLQQAKKSQKGVDLLYKYCEFFRKDNIEKVIQIIVQYLSATAKSHEKLEKYSFQLALEFISLEKAHQNKDQISLLLLFTNNMFYKKCNGKIKIFSDLKLFSEALSIEQENLEKFFNFCIRNSRYLFFSPRRTKKRLLLSSILPLFHLPLKNENQINENVQVFWKSVFLEQEISKILAHIYQLLSTITHYDLLILFSDRKREGEQLEEDEIKKEKFFKSFLFEKKIVSKDYIWEMKRSRELEFKKAGQVLTELCSYSQDNEKFTYKSTQQYPNELLKINYNETTLSMIKETKVDIFSQIHLDEQKKKQLFEIFFNHPTFLPNFKKMWSQMIVKCQENIALKNHYIQKEIGQVYLVVLMIIDKLNEKKNKELHSYLEEIRQNTQQRLPYTDFAEETKINTLFAIKNEQKEVKQESEPKKGEEVKALKSRGSEKKGKLLQKFKKNQELILERNLSHASQEDQSTDLCLLCHEKPKKSRPLIFFSEIQKNKTLSSSIYGNQNKASVLITTCFHMVHLDCFINMEKQIVSFSCPLCSKKGNCILPAHYDPSEKKLLRTCTNSINASLMILYKVYQPQSNFILFFKHLLESKGLNSLIFQQIYDKQKAKRQKVDEYILNLLSEMYKVSSQSKKAQYDNEIKELLKYTSQCKKVFAQIQQILIKSIRDKICLGTVEPDLKLLRQIKGQIPEDQFLILVNELEELTNQFILVQGEEELPKEQKVSLAFHIIQLPNTSQNIQNFGLAQCQDCNKEKRITRCLLCGHTLCRICHGGHNEKSHDGRWIFFQYSEGKMIVETRSEQYDLHVYKNEFFMPYQMKNQLPNVEVFRLNKKSVQKGIEKFLLAN